MEQNTLRTERLLLRPWREDDAEALYEYAKDPRVGPVAGWPVHTDVEDSRRVIRDVLSEKECYAIVPKDADRPVGSIGLMVGRKGEREMGAGGAEIGYWIGVPFWGRGLVPEAVRELLRHAFEDLKLETVWCGYYDGNEKSRRVQEKCGFVYHHTEPEKDCPLLHETRTEHFTRMTRAEWLRHQGGRE